MIPKSIFSLLMIFVAWWLSSYVETRSYMLPPPSKVLHVFSFSRFWGDILRTTVVALSGLMLGTLIGAFLGVLFLVSDVSKQYLYSLVVAFRSIPVVAFTYVIVIWFGPGYVGHVLLCSAIVLGPVTMAFVEGNETIPSSRVRLFALYAANPWKKLVKLQLPSVVPDLFSALKLSASLAVVGAIVAEMGGSDSGLGYRLVVAGQRINELPTNFAVIIASAVLALGLYWAVERVQKVVQPIYLEDNSGVKDRES